MVLERCDLTGADLTGVTFERCRIDGCTLDSVRGLASLAGVTMPWPDVVELAPVFAQALGVAIDPEPGDR